MNRIRRLLSILSMALTLTAALSLAAAGGAHRIAGSDAAQQTLIAALGLPIGAVCGEGQQDGRMQGDCPVCHLASAALLPDPVTSAASADLRLVALVLLPQSQRAADTPFDPARSLRGPPVV